MTPPIRPERRALLELDSLLTELERLVGEGDAARFGADDRYRWVIERLWIAMATRHSPTPPTWVTRTVSRGAHWSSCVTNSRIGGCRISTGTRFGA